LLQLTPALLGAHLPVAVMQPYDDPYIPRTYPHLLKWKFPHMNSVDFKLIAIQGKHCLAGSLASSAHAHAPARCTRTHQLCKVHIVTT